MGRLAELNRRTVHEPPEGSAADDPFVQATRQQRAAVGSRREQLHLALQAAERSRDREAKSLADERGQLIDEHKQLQSERDLLDALQQMRADMRNGPHSRPGRHASTPVCPPTCPLPPTHPNTPRLVLKARRAPTSLSSAPPLTLTDSAPRTPSPRCVPSNSPCGRAFSAGGQVAPDARSAHRSLGRAA